MTSRKEKEILKQASGRGDSLADAALRDINEEESGAQGDEFRPPQRGDWVTIFTVGFHYAGRITGVDHEYIGLARNHAWINTSGDIPSVERGHYADWEMSKLPDYIPKGAIYCIKVHDKPIVLKN